MVDAAISALSVTSILFGWLSTGWMLLAEADTGTESAEETGTENDPILLIADDGQLSTRVD